MAIRSAPRLVLFATGIFLIIAFGLASVFRGPLSHRQDIFAQRTEYVTKTPFWGTDKLSETDFHLLGGEPGQDGTNSRNGVSGDGGPPGQEVVAEEGEQENEIDEGNESESVSESVEETLQPSTAATTSSPTVSESSTPAQSSAPTSTGWHVMPPGLTNFTNPDEDWDEYEKPWVENVQEGEDVSNLLTPEQHEASNQNQLIEHIEIFSNITDNGRWFLLDFISQGGYNPNIIPHPYKNDSYIMIAVRDKQYDDNEFWNAELVCEGHFVDNVLRCKAPPSTLPIASTYSEHCIVAEFMTWQIGPHDARIFYGPDRPFIIYGSQSQYNCLGQWIQDLRRITDFAHGRQGDTVHTDPFFFPTELQRPPPYREIEKNWFPFWDSNGTMYMHYDLEPRVFAQLHPNGSVGPDLAPLARTHDEQCMAKHMPKLHPTGLEWNHQGTNSLSITLCKRADPGCVPSENNTFIFTIIQTKTFYMHGNYEPYAFVFKQQAPFELHAISSKPYWYTGRGRAGEHWTDSTWKPIDQSEMVFTVSMSWKEQGLMYHGYLDDTVFICFGIEDNHGGGIDVVAEELMKDLAFC